MSPESRKAVETVLIEEGFKPDDPDLERRVVRVHSTRRSPPLSLPESRASSRRSDLMILIPLTGRINAANM